MDVDKRFFNKREWHLKDIPKTIIIETVMGCNLRCEMCPVPDSKLLMNGRTYTTMDLETFSTILREIADSPRELHLNQMGEPLLNKSIGKFVELSKEAGHKVAFTTNGSLMNDVIARKLLVSGIDHVTFSIDGYSARTYESIRIGASYEKVRSNVENFINMRNDLNRNTTIQIDCILSDLTSHEIPLMRKFWNRKVDFLNVIPLNDWAGKLKLPVKFGSRNRTDKVQDNARYPCDLLWTTLSISAEGYVMYCCHDYKLLSNLPNVKDKPLRQIWENNMSEERRKHVEQMIDKEPCLHCDAWKTRPQYFSRYSLSQICAELISSKYRLCVKKLIQRIKWRVSR